MCTLKSISGHTGLSRCKDYLHLGKGEVRRYFEGAGKERCIAKDFVNITRLREADWDRAMDETRRANGNDKSYGGKAPRTYEHFIISPDPTDEIDIDTLRELAVSWCEEHFGEGGDVGLAECAIVYHDDNSERAARGLPGIPHAHVIVNNTDLETGRRLHMSNKQVRGLGESLERIAKDLGLSYFTVDRYEKDGKAVVERRHHSVKEERKAQEYERRTRLKARRDNRPSGQLEYRTMTERSLRAEGKAVWKDDLRETIRIACNLSRDMDGLRDALLQMGVVTEERKGKRAIDGELVFYYPSPGVAPEDNKRRVSGQRLGRSFTPDGLRDMMKLAYYQKLVADDRDEARIMSLVADVYTVRVDRDAQVDLLDISKAFAAITTSEIQNIEDAKQALAKTRQDLSWMKPDHASYDAWIRRRDNLEALVRIADKTNILPENEYKQQSLPPDYKVVREQRRRQFQGEVTLDEKIERGYRLSKAEHEKLRKERPRDLVRWQQNRRMASWGKTPDEIAEMQRSSSSNSGGASGRSGRSGGSRSDPAPMHSRVR